MKILSETWFAEGYIDFELKKYTLLAYLQEVSKYFNENKLYPQLADVIFHYNNIVAFRENKKFLQEHFPKQLTDVNMQKLQLVYERSLYVLIRQINNAGGCLLLNIDFVSFLSKVL